MVKRLGIDRYDPRPAPTPSGQAVRDLGGTLPKQATHRYSNYHRSTTYKAESVNQCASHSTDFIKFPCFVKFKYVTTAFSTRRPSPSQGIGLTDLTGLPGLRQGYTTFLVGNVERLRAEMG